MDWIQVAHLGHHVMGERTNAHLRKGYKVGDLSKNKDPDKSNTPLLHDQSQSFERDEPRGDDSWDAWPESRGSSQASTPMKSEDWADDWKDDWGSSEAKTSSKSKSGLLGSSKSKDSPQRASKGSKDSSKAVAGLKGKRDEEKMLIDFGDETATGGVTGGQPQGNWEAEWEDNWGDEAGLTPKKGYQRITSKKD